MRLLSLGAVALTACGFLGEAPFAGRRAPDVAPWSDVGPLVLCDGTTRLGPSSDGARGLCAVPSQSVVACASDVDCAARERCVCGQCRVPSCDDAEECDREHGWVCTFAEHRCDRACGTDGDCAAGERCLPGRNVCRGPCAATADCQAGERCQLATGLCVTTACADDATCGGVTCRLERVAADTSEPFAVADPDGRTHLYFTRELAGATTLADAVAADPATRRFTVGDLALAGRAPAVVDTAAGRVLFFEDAAGTLQRTLLPSLTPTPVGPGLAPGVARDASGVHLYSAVSDGSAILRRDADDAADAFSDPVAVLTLADVTSPGWRNVDRLASPFADAAGHLWFSAHGEESADSMQFGMPVALPANESIGVATATAGGFVAFAGNPVFDRVIDFLNHQSERGPAVLVTPATWYLFYERRDVVGAVSGGLAVARSPVQP